MLVNSEVYTSADKLADIIADNSLMLMAISRFGLTLGQANKTVEQMCADTGVDAATFLCVANMVSGKPYSVENVNLVCLTAYLKRAHAFFLDFFLPSIRRKFITAVDFASAGDVPQLILRFFDEYVAEVRRHMDFENKTLFGYIDKLLNGIPVDDSYDISVFASHHDAISQKLNRLKDVLIRYCPAGDTDILNSVLFDIISCEADLISHCEVEDNILVPAVMKAEQLAVRIPASAAPEKTAENDSANSLGRREKEIITCIAMGMSNKEIAEKLCISVHTVTTHRRNICSKLEIHSPAGLTIYAILNGLVDPKELM